MKIADQPWYEHPIHREATYALSVHAEGLAAWPNPTIFADRALAEEHIRFLSALRNRKVKYWDMSSEEFAALKQAWRKGTLDDDGCIQWWQQIGQHEADHDDDYPPDGPREEQSE